jgi:negative regulator of sigma E activity
MASIVLSTCVSRVGQVSGKKEWPVTLTELAYVAVVAAIVLVVVIPIARAVASLVVPLSIVTVIALIVLDQVSGGRVMARATDELAPLLKSLLDRIGQRAPAP